MKGRTLRHAGVDVVAVLVAVVIFLVPFAGFAVLALSFLVHDRRVWFGIAAMSLFFFPLFLVMIFFLTRRMLASER